MNLGLIKSGIQLVTGFGAGLLADEAVKRVKPKNLKGLKNIAVKIGGFVISAMVAEKATEFVGKAMDDAVEDVKELMSPPKEVISEVTEEVE